MVKEPLSPPTLEEKEAQGNGHRHAQPKAEALVSSSGSGHRQDDPAGASASLEEVGISHEPLGAGSKLYQPGVETERVASSSLPQAELGYVTPWGLESKSMDAQGEAAARAGAGAPVSDQQVRKDNASRRGADDSMLDGLAVRSGLQGEDAAAKTERERLEVETEQLRQQVPCCRTGVWIWLFHVAFIFLLQSSLCTPDQRMHHQREREQAREQARAASRKESETKPKEAEQQRAAEALAGQQHAAKALAEQQRAAEALAEQQRAAEAAEDGE